MKVSVNQEKCISCRLCTVICPEVFQMNEEGFSTVKVEVVPVHLESAVKKAAESCMMKAIEIS